MMIRDYLLNTYLKGNSGKNFSLYSECDERFWSKSCVGPALGCMGPHDMEGPEADI